MRLLPKYRPIWILILGMALQVVALVAYQHYHDQLVRKGERGYPYLVKQLSSHRVTDRVYPRVQWLSTDTLQTLVAYHHLQQTELEIHDYDWKVLEQYRLPYNISLEQGFQIEDVNADGFEEIVCSRFWPVETAHSDDHTELDSLYISAYNNKGEEIIVDRWDWQFFRTQLGLDQDVLIRSCEIYFDAARRASMGIASDRFFALHTILTLEPFGYKRFVILYKKGLQPERVAVVETALISNGGVWSKTDKGNEVYTFGGSPPGNGREVLMPVKDGSYLRLRDDRHQIVQLDTAGNVNWIRDLGSGGGESDVVPGRANSGYLCVISRVDALNEDQVLSFHMLRLEDGHVHQSLTYTNEKCRIFLNTAAYETDYVAWVSPENKQSQLVTRNLETVKFPLKLTSAYMIADAPVFRLPNGSYGFLNSLDRNNSQIIDLSSGKSLATLPFGFAGWPDNQIGIANGSGSDLIWSRRDYENAFELVANPFPLWPVWHHRWLIVFALLPLILTLGSYAMAVILHRRRAEQEDQKRQYELVTVKLEAERLRANKLQKSLEQTSVALNKASAGSDEAARYRTLANELKEELHSQQATYLAQLENLLASIDEGVAELDQKGTVLQVNQAFERILGPNGGSCTGRHISDVLNIEDVRVSNWLETAATKPHLARSMETTVTVKDEHGGLPLRKRLRLSLNAFPSNGKRHRLLIVHRDVSVEPALDSESSHIYRFGELISCSPQMESIFEELEQAGQTIAPILLTGETGTGKTELARESHKLGARKNKPFIERSLADIPATLMESILFGTRKHSFTHAADTPGLFQLANGGTLFLDEISEIPLEIQTKLLKALDSNPVEIWPVGAKKPDVIDVKLIAATNQDLSAVISAGKFRNDLYYRLKGSEINVPPLRTHPEDIPLLAQYFLRQYGGDSLKISDRDMTRLREYDWPGNVRELQRTLEKTAYTALRRGNKRISIISQFSNTSSSADNRGTAGPADGPADPTFAQAESGPIHETNSHESNHVRSDTSGNEDEPGGKRVPMPPAEELKAMMDSYQGNKSALARHYGVTRQTIHNWLQKQK